MPDTLTAAPKNSLVGGTVRRSFWACFPLALTGSITSFVDTILAGAFFSASHLAAVGVASAVGSLITAILMILAHGSYSSYANALGRGQRRKSGEIFTVGVILILALGLLLSVVVGALAEPVVRLFGAATQELEQFAAEYLRVALFSYPLTALIYQVTLVIGIYGFRRQTLLSNIVNFVTNVLFSVHFIRVLPGIGLGALGLGTICSGLCSLAICAVSILARHMSLLKRPRLAAFGWKRMKSVLLSGLTTSSNILIDGLIGALLNQIIVLHLGSDGLAVYSVVLCFWRLAQVPSDALDYAVAPLFGICYVRRDRSALRKAGIDALKLGFVYCVLWIVFLFALTGPLLRLYTAGGSSPLVSAPARGGVYLTLAFTPVYLLGRALTTFYDASDLVPYSLAMAIIPDSVLFPLMLVILLPRLGYTGLWLSLGGNTLAFFVFFYIVHIFRGRRFPVSLDTLFHFDDGICAEYPQIDESISFDDTDVSRLSEAIQHFLQQEHAGSRVSYVTALCMDELSTDIISHSRSESTADGGSLMDVKMISEPDAFQIIIRSRARPYNPLDFDYENESFSKVGVMMAQRLARKIDYDYVYGINMITIQIEKQPGFSDHREE